MYFDIIMIFYWMIDKHAYIICINNHVLSCLISILSAPMLPRAVFAHSRAVPVGPRACTPHPRTDAPAHAPAPPCTLPRRPCPRALPMRPCAHASSPMHPCMRSPLAYTIIRAVPRTPPRPRHRRFGLPPLTVFATYERPSPSWPTELAPSG